MHHSRLLACYAALAFVACAEEPSERDAEKAAVGPAAPSPPAVAPPKAPAREAEPANAQACARVEPHFAYDDIQPLPPASQALEGLARCLSSSLQGDEAITVVGRTDARGSDAYNRDLGRRRAERVRSILVAHGLQNDRIHVKSAGERDAKGHLPGHTRAEDRRVDIIRSDERVSLK